MVAKNTLRVGIGGPVGSGKTALVEALCRQLTRQFSVAVVTNDIYTKEDAEFLTRSGVLAAERIIGVETGGCPHTAIREDASLNIDALEKLEKLFQPDIIFLESGGDNLAATFSPELVDSYIYVIDVAEGDKIPRKGGPAIRRSDLLVINKIDLAPYVGADLKVMERDSKLMRGQRPFLFTDLRHGQGVDKVIDWLLQSVFMQTCAESEGRADGAMKRKNLSNLGIVQLCVEATTARSVVTSQYSQAPLQLHRPLYLHPHSPPVVYMKTPSSGLLHGDEHKIEVSLLEGAALELRTQACTLVYPGRSQQSFVASLGRGSKLKFHPHSLILAAQAEFTQTVEIHLSQGASLDYEEGWCAGRIAMGEGWQFKSFDYGLRIWQDDALIYRERWILTPATQSLTSAFICSEYTHFRTAYIFGAADGDVAGATDVRPETAAIQAEPVQPEQQQSQKRWIMETAAGKVERVAYL